MTKPFQTEEIFDTLATLLGVTYQYSDDIISTITPEVAAIDLNTLQLPNELCESLVNAAKLYDFSTLEALIAEVEKQDINNAKLSAHLRGMLDNYDMDAIVDLLQAKM